MENEEYIVRLFKGKIDIKTNIKTIINIVKNDKNIVNYLNKIPFYVENIMHSKDHIYFYHILKFIFIKNNKEISNNLYMIFIKIFKDTYNVKFLFKNKNRMSKLDFNYALYVFSYLSQYDYDRLYYLYYLLINQYNLSIDFCYELTEIVGRKNIQELLQMVVMANNNKLCTSNLLLEIYYKFKDLKLKRFYYIFDNKIIYRKSKNRIDDDYSLNKYISYKNKVIKYMDYDSITKYIKFLNKYNKKNILQNMLKLNLNEKHCILIKNYLMILKLKGE
jgi:hypothetical protein